MKRTALLVATLLAASTAGAQIYQWKDANGKTVVSDKPPTGSVSQQKKFDAEAATPPSAPQKSGAEREMEFRKRQMESGEKAEKAQKEERAAAEKAENCERARRYLQSLENGDRIAGRDSKGERYIMEDAQRAAEIGKTKETIQSSCK